MKPCLVGITGSIGSGKSTVCKIIQSLNYPLIDCDVISHEILNDKATGYNQVLEAFSTAILDDNQMINRQKLGEIVFGDSNKRQTLEGILHPLIKQRIKAIIADSIDKVIFMECPLLFETDFHELCDYTVVVYVDLDNQIWRVMKRDNVDFPTALNRIYTQMSLSEKMERADFIIDNCHQQGDLNWQVKQIIEKIERMI